MTTPLQPTSLQDTQDMIAAYTSGLWQVSTDLLKAKFTDRPGIQEAKSTWLSRADLNQLLDDNNANGLRIYYGVHNKSTLPATAPFEYLGLHNVILVATVDSVDPNNPTLENSIDQLKANGGIVPGGFLGLAGDFTPLCPPNCPPPPRPTETNKKP